MRRGGSRRTSPRMLPAAYVVSEILLPLVFAIVLKLLLQPALRVLERLHVPRILAALLLILALFGMVIGLGTAISGPARTWAAKLPEGIPRLEERLSFMRAPINTLQVFLQQVENIGETGRSPNGAISERGATVLLNLFTGTRNFASGFFTTVCFFSPFSCLAIFFCIASSRYCRALGVSARSWKSRSKKRRRFRVSGHNHDHELENRCSATALAMWFTGVGDPILWGTVAFLLNYVRPSAPL